MASESLEIRQLLAIGQVALPIDNPVVDGHGYAAHVEDHLYHAGEDYSAAPGTPVKAIADGVIKYASYDPNQRQRWDYDQRGYGNLVILEHTRADGSRFHSIYGHLSPNGLHSGNSARAGETIGFVGEDRHNGAGGPHLHLQVHDGPFVDTSYSRIGGWLGTNYSGWQTKLRPSAVIGAWDFHRNGSGWESGRHGWTVRNGVHRDDLSGTMWTIDPNASDPGIQTSGLRLDPRFINAIGISLRSNMPDNRAQLFFTTRNDPAWTESKSLTVTIPTAQQSVVAFDMRSLPSWLNGGEITGLRFDPGRYGRSDSSDIVQIDRIEAVRIVSFRSMNYPDHIIRHRNSEAFIDRSDGSQLFQMDSAFVVRPGLSDSQYVSLESLNYPGHYLRHANYRLILSRNDRSDLFRRDATFIPRQGLGTSGGLSLESYNYRGHYLRHRNYQLWLDRFQESSLYRRDATFFVY